MNIVSLLSSRVAIKSMTKAIWTTGLLCAGANLFFLFLPHKDTIYFIRLCCCCCSTLFCVKTLYLLDAAWLRLYEMALDAFYYASITLMTMYMMKHRTMAAEAGDSQLPWAMVLSGCCLTVLTVVGYSVWLFHLYAFNDCDQLLHANYPIEIVLEYIHLITTILFCLVTLWFVMSRKKFRPDNNFFHTSLMVWCYSLIIIDFSIASCHPKCNQVVIIIACRTGFATIISRPHNYIQGIFGLRWVMQALE